MFGRVLGNQSGHSGAYRLCPLKSVVQFQSWQDGKSRDPQSDLFDLLLIAQAISENLVFLTADSEILKLNRPGLQLIDASR